MSEPVFNVQQAAEAAGVSRSTIYRHLETLLEHGATRDETGTRIPFSALIGAGLAPRTSPPETSRETRSETRNETGLATGETTAERELREQLMEAQARITALEHGKALAEAIAAERERIIEIQSRALRLLEAGPVRHGETGPVSRGTRNETSPATRENPLQHNGNPESGTGPATRETVPETDNETTPETLAGHGETSLETGGDGSLTASEPASAGNPLPGPGRPLWKRLWPF